MTTCKKLREDLQFYEGRVCDARRILARAEAGTLHIARSNNRRGFRWRISRINPENGRRERIIIPQHDEEYAADMAYSTYLQKRTEEDLHEIQAIRHFLDHHIEEPHGLPQGDSRAEFTRLLEKRISLGQAAMDEVSRRWMNEPYNRYEDRPEDLTHPSLCGIKMRSKSEVSIADELYLNGIAFRYEQKMTINGRAVVPDFVIMHPVTHEIYIWEHFGRMDDPQYIRRNYGKTDEYALAGYVLGINLIVTTETKRKPFEGSHARKTVQDYFL